MSCNLLSFISQERLKEKNKLCPAWRENKVEGFSGSSNIQSIQTPHVEFAATRYNTDSQYGKTYNARPDRFMKATTRKFLV